MELPESERRILSPGCCTREREKGRRREGREGGGKRRERERGREGRRKGKGELRIMHHAISLIFYRN